MRPFFGRVLIGTALLGMAGCAAPTQKLMYSEDELAAILRTRLGDESKAIPIPFRADEQMIAFARQATADEKTIRGQVDALARAITARALLNVHYDAGSSITAREVFDNGRANCIAYTNLFVALARAIGLEALYADVTERSYYVRRASTIIHIGHICAAVRDGPQVLLVDFSDESRLQYLGYRLIDDVEALANFEINQGIDFGGLLAMPDTPNQQLEFSDADMDKFRVALLIKPGFGKALVNLGSAYLRRGQKDLAEERFRTAIRLNPEFAPGYTVLGSLLLAQGRVSDALELYKVAVSHQKNNPYLLQNLAMAQFRLRHYKDAARAARAAIRAAKRQNESFADPHHLLGIIAQIRGQPQEARVRFLEALALDPTLDDARTRLMGINDALGLDRQSSVPAKAPIERVAAESLQ
jgi:Flp pilus assembly protein TadD